MEGVVHEGWLVKSPPEKRILKAKWRQRWFVLRHSGLLPGQFILEYFTDNSCKKLKGKIDLDQCEQVDAGLTFESKKTSYQYMFDIRTPKRIYYLVAETEAEMNKWVDCICSVCGLKIHVEEGSVAAFESSSLNSFSVLSQGLLSSTTLLSSIGFNNNYLVSPDASATGTTTTYSAKITTATNLAQAKGSCSPYIPISECHTGKPVLNGNLPLEDGFKDLPRVPPPPPPPKTELSSLELTASGEFYDYPRPLNPQVGFNNFAMTDGENEANTYKIPNHAKSDFSAANVNSSFNTLPPKVNWSTYPENSICNSSTVPRKMSHIKPESAEYDIVPSFHGPMKELEVTRKNVQDLASHFENISLKTTEPQLLQTDAANSGHSSETHVVPPRPPKPSKMRDRCRYENFELPHQTLKEEELSAYDIPPTSKGVFLSKQLPAQTFSFLKNDSIDDLSPSTKVPLSSSVGKENLLMDDTYDFPKFRSEDNINAMVPLSHSVSTSQRQRRHAYTNAPPGLFNSKDLIFNYEYRPSLMSGDVYMSADLLKSEQSAHTPADTMTPPSPSVMGAYANLPTSPTAANYQNDVPPVVNRDLKPKRVPTNEDRGSISFLTLQPPPVCRSRTKANKRSFRKPRAAPSPTPLSSLNGMPPVPNRFRHHPDVSTTSDDELSNSSGSRRNSSNDDQARQVFSVSNKKDEIQYLDLDLDSEPSPSPKSPERMTASTVYKKVDFVKTKAFNEMRQNVEETYRKSQ